MKTRVLSIVLLCWSLAGPSLADDTDWETRRFAFAASPGYDGYRLTAGEIGVSLRARKLWQQGDATGAVKLLEDWVAGYPLSIAGHRMLDEFDAKLASDARDDVERERLENAAAAHRAAYVGLLTSVAHGTQCASIDDHCKVINIAEENGIIVDAGGRNKPRQAVVPNGDAFYDMVVANDGRGNERTFYFDISSFYKGPFTGRMEMGTPKAP